MKHKSLLLLVLLICGTLYAQTPTYYNDVNLNLTGQDLKNALETKIVTTHTNFLSYTPGIWTTLQQADLDPNNSNNVLLIYGYDDTDGDLKTDRSRSKTANGGGAGEWNREHAYPKSLGNPNLGTSGPGSDAHHLRASDIQMNASRSNRVFASGNGNASITSQGYFYPGDEWKGDVARMMMFMYVRYGSRCLPNNVGIGNAVAGDANMIDLFLQWNAEDPVNFFEDNRNVVIAGIQGNRNPFIDNPALATQIWGGPQAEDRFGSGGTGSVSDLFISEYVEGSSNNKALEVANFTGSSVNLSGYSLRKQTNGAGSWNSGYALSGTLSSGDVFVLAHSSSTSTVQANADATTSASSITFNGNDPVGLFKNGVLIDIIGVFNGGSSNFAKDKTLRRKSSVLNPNVAYTTTEWDTYSQNTFSDLGSHTVDGGSTADTTAPSIPSNLNASNITETSANLSWTASTDNTAVTGYDVYQDGSLLTSITTTSFGVNGLSASTSYNFTVRANDAAGNNSSLSSVLNVTTDAIVLSYCNSNGNNTNYEYIDFVGLGGISNATAANGGYADFTNQLGTIAYGANTIVLSVGFSGSSYTENWKVWIDFNQNGTFESSEEVVTGSTSSTGNLSYNFNVPSSAVSGTTRMRVSMKWNGAPAACETFSYGEVEDYNVSIGNSSARSTNGTNVKVNGVLTQEHKVFDATVYTSFDVLNVQMQDSRKVNYVLTNIIGEVVANGEFKNQLKLSRIESGIYILKITDGQRTISKKLVKQ
jgi:endonuclease I/chitodextrinase